MKHEASLKISKILNNTTTTKTTSDNGFCPLSDIQENRGLLRCRLIRTSDNGTYRCVRSRNTSVYVFLRVVLHPETTTESFNKVLL